MSSILSTPKLDQSADGVHGRTPCTASPHSGCDGFQYLDARAFAGEESTAGSTTDWNLQSSLPRASSHPPRTPPRRRMSWAFRRNHGDPFFGAKEAKASPITALCDVRTPPATGGDMVQPELPISTGPVSRTEVSEQHESPLAKRIIKRIPRILFPSSHQRPRSTSNARHTTELRNYEYVSCCAGCYGSGVLCDKREKGMCSHCEREGQTVVQLDHPCRAEGEGSMVGLHTIEPGGMDN